MKKPSVIVSIICLAAIVATFFLVKPWYFGLLAAFAVLLGTAAVRGIYQSARRERLIEKQLERVREITTRGQVEALHKLDKQRAKRDAQWARFTRGMFSGQQRLKH